MQTLETLVRYFRSKGVVGEEENCALQALATSMRIHYGMEGPSGSGKSFIVEPFIELLDDLVYRMELSSENAEMYNSREINQHKIIYIPELQKAMARSPLVTEIVKNLTEGKDATRRVTNQSRTGNDTYRITKGKQVIYTLADQNSYKKDAELSRRFLQLSTDSSEEHLDEILRAKAEQRFLTAEEQEYITTEEVEELKKRILKAFKDEYTNYINPFSPYLASFLPREVPSLSLDDHYFNLMCGNAKLANERMKENMNEFLELQDAYIIHSLAGNIWPQLRGVEVEWEACMNEGFRRMYDKFPDIAEQWLTSQIRDDAIELRDINGNIRPVSM